MSDGFASLATEQSDPRYGDIDRLSVLEIARLMNAADAEVPAAVGRALPAIAATIDAVVERLSDTGRLLYVGAGSSGRLAVLDAAECPPTFGTHPELVQGIIAGGPDALMRSIEGSEDDSAGGAAAIAEAVAGPRDVVIGISASGRTPYVVGAVGEARRRGALTAGVACTKGGALSRSVDHPIEVVVGAEVIAGSTRLKAGTATKLVLNMISTITMIKLGRTYGNRMVELSAMNSKLADRATRIITDVTGADERSARKTLEDAGRHVKVAIVMLEHGVDAAGARAILEARDGRLEAVLDRRRPNGEPVVE
ncbi:MAG TPA: N-acetylmuramic acid 6-phosphate etherase [Jiangellaceae bacterium]